MAKMTAQLIIQKYKRSYETIITMHTNKKF